MEPTPTSPATQPGSFPAPPPPRPSSLVTYERPFLQVPVADRIPGAVSQVATWVETVVAQRPENGGVLTLKVELRVDLFDKATGEPLNSRGFVSYPVFLSADNNTGVNPETGEIYALRQGGSDEAWERLLATWPVPIMKQADQMQRQFDTGAIYWTPTLRHFIEQANDERFRKF